MRALETLKAKNFAIFELKHANYYYNLERTKKTVFIQNFMFFFSNFHKRQEVFKS